LVVTPVLYAIFFNVREGTAAPNAAGPAPAAEPNGASPS